MKDIGKSQICILQEQNSLIITNTNNYWKKLLDINKNQIKTNCLGNGYNQSDKRQGMKVVPQSN